MEYKISEIITVVIPCYKVSKTILKLIQSIDHNIQNIIVVDDCCPEKSGELVLRLINDKRVIVLFHPTNLGVGGAMKTGYKKALELNSDIVVKLDGDGQMDPSLIIDFVVPILIGEADYTKGNRFYRPESCEKMPTIRLIGNGMLCFINKVVSGYWTIMDPTNGYTAIHALALKNLPFNKIDNRYFFENDMLFRLNTIRAKVEDIPMEALYGDEKSNLSICKTTLEFPFKYASRFFKRILYNYYIRDFNIGSLEIFFGILLFGFGSLYGLCHWIHSYLLNIDTPTGTVILSSTSILIGFKLLLSAADFDMRNIPHSPISRFHSTRRNKKGTIYSKVS
jgi:dolichol-phosphate mannosyltransferase